MSCSAIHKSARPMARCWWPEMDVEREELLRQVHDMDEAGQPGGEIQLKVDVVYCERR